MAEPFLLIGGAALIFYLLLGDDAKAAPLPKPVVKPDTKNTTIETSSGFEKPYVYESAYKFGQDNGYEVGYAHGSTGSAKSPTPPATDGFSYEEQVKFNEGYNEGYLKGYEVGRAEFASVDPDATRPSGGGGFGPQGSKSGWDGTSPVVSDGQDSRVTGIHYASVDKRFHAGVRGLAQQNNGTFKNITLTATVKGMNVEAVVIGEPRRIASLGREAMPAVVMSAGPYHGHKLIILD